MKRLIGGIFLAAGILIGGASGLCTAIVGLPMALSSGPGGFLNLGPAMAVFGGIPMAIGFGLYKWGRSLIRQANETGHDDFG